MVGRVAPEGGSRREAAARGYDPDLDRAASRTPAQGADGRNGYAVGRSLFAGDLRYIKQSNNRRYKRAILTALSIDTQHPSCANCGHSDYRVLRIRALPGSPDSRAFRNSYQFYNYVLANPTLYGLICENCNVLANAAMISVTHSIRAAIRKARILADPEGTAALISDGIDPAGDVTATLHNREAADLPPRPTLRADLDPGSDYLLDPTEIANSEAAKRAHADSLLADRISNLTGEDGKPLKPLGTL